MKNLFLVFTSLVFIALINFSESERKSIAQNQLERSPASADPFDSFNKNGSFEFNYSFNGEKLKISKKAKSASEAFSLAASECFSYYSKKSKSFNREVGTLIIDSCANPR